MAFDTKPNLSNDKFEQFSGETLTLKGTTEVHGRFEVESGGTFQLNDGTQQDGYVMTSNASGEASWSQIAAGESVTKQITQATHGFILGDVIAYSGTSYIKAIADGTQDGETLGIVSAVGDANTFTLITVGFVDTLTGLSANTTYFVSDATVGLLTSIQPSTVGSISKPILVTTISTEGYILNYRGLEVNSGGTSGDGTITGATNGLTAIGADIILGGVLTGNTKIDTTTFGLDLDLGIITSVTSLVSADIGASTDEAILSFRNESGNNVASGFLDIALGTNNINASSEAWGSIAIGQSNLTSLAATGDFAGGRNVAVGFSVGCDLTTGSNNVLLGRNVFQSSTTGSYNVMGGYGAGQNMTVNGKSNVALGLFAMRTITGGTGNYNTAIGTWAASEPASLGNYNTTIGNQSMQCAGTVSNWNTAVGSHAFQQATLGLSNTGVGISAGRFADSIVGSAMIGWQAGFSFGGSYNIALGASAGCALDATSSTGGTILTGSRNVFIGYKPTWSLATPSISDTFVIGNSFEATESDKIYLASKGDIELIAAHDTSSGVTTMTSSGLYYDEDYSATGSTNPRWIPDNAYVTGLTASGGTASGDKLEKTITQTAHGFSVGDVLAYSGGSYIKALADGNQDAETLGVVSVVTDVNNFTLVYTGYIDTLTPLSLSANTTYYLSTTTAGGLTSTEPTGTDEITKPILTTLTATDGVVFQYRGYIVASASTGSTGGDGVVSGATLTGTTVLTLSRTEGLSNVIVDLAPVSGGNSTGSTIVGDDSTTGFTLTHNFGTRDVIVQVFENQLPYGNPIIDVERTTTNAIDVNFAVAPATGTDYRVLILEI